MLNSSGWRIFTSWFLLTAWRRVLARMIYASALAMLHVAVRSMLAHDASRKHKTLQLSKVCVGHARLSSDRIATVMVAKLVITKNTTMLENASNSLGLKPSSRENVAHAQLRLVVARSVLSAKGLAKTLRALE